MVCAYDTRNPEETRAAALKKENERLTRSLQRLETLLQRLKSLPRNESFELLEQLRQCPAPKESPLMASTPGLRAAPGSLEIRSILNEGSRSGEPVRSPHYSSSHDSGPSPPGENRLSPVNGASRSAYSFREMPVPRPYVTGGQPPSLSTGIDFSSMRGLPLPPVDSILVDTGVIRR